jgi:Calcineurin-like phosphoesterase
VKAVNHRSFEAPLAELSGPLAPPSALEAGGGEDDAALRAALTEALAALEDVQGPEGVLASPQHQLAALLQTYSLEHPPPDVADVSPSPLEVQFDKGDLLGWARSVLDWWRKIKPEPWIEASDEPESVGDGGDLRIALLGDWGTGLYGAPVCARSIEADGAYDLLVHLGDVYYSGTPKEVRENFLAHWPSVPGAVSRAVNSNHEMYSGGEGLFKETLPAFGQRATHWAVQTEGFLLVGLDSAYKDHDIAFGQVAWLNRLLAQAGDRKLVLFTHHQPFSLLDKQGPKLVEDLGQLLSAGRIFAWYWGHEHRCVLYDAHPRWKLHGRCAGHSGMPYYRDDVRGYQPDGGDERWRRVPAKNLVPGGVLLDIPNRYIPEHAERYGANGYLTLELSGSSLHEVVRAPDGAVLREGSL